MRKPIEAVHCDRCGKEIAQEAPLAEGTKEVPAYYRLIQSAGEEIEKTLTHLCDRCKGEVKELDARIFSDSRVRRTGDAENGEKEKGATNDA